MTKIAFLKFMLKVLFVREIFTFLFRLLGYFEKQLDKKVKLNCKIYGVIDWTINNYITHITQSLKKLRQSDNKIWSVNKK